MTPAELYDLGQRLRRQVRGSFLEYIDGTMPLLLDGAVFKPPSAPNCPACAARQVKRTKEQKARRGRRRREAA